MAIAPDDTARIWVEYLKVRILERLSERDLLGIRLAEVNIMDTIDPV